jgi:hypothetical protein
VFFAATARIVKLDAVVIADGGKVIGIEERSGVGEFRAFVAILEATARITDVEVNIEFLTWGERRCQFIDGVEIARAGRYNMERRPNRTLETD